MDEKKLHTQEFQLKGVGSNMRSKLLQKRSTEKTTPPQQRPQAGHRVYVMQCKDY